ncbi:hypothetical protein KR074_009671 [Drosophila pseudoananassae]|nr:hypothetical protein KR074_009671 [Drosophila pseudoananassae]
MNMTWEDYEKYRLIKRELDNETLLTFKDLLELTQFSPRKLSRTLDKLAREGGFYKEKKGAAPVVAAGLAEASGNAGTSGSSGNSGRAQGSMPPGSKGAKKKLELEFEKAAASQVKAKAKDGSSVLCASFNTMSLDQNDNDEEDDEEPEEMMSFEDLVILTRTHPLLLERSIRRMARRGRFLKYEK